MKRIKTVLMISLAFLAFLAFSGCSITYSKLADTTWQLTEVIENCPSLDEDGNVVTDENGIVFVTQTTTTKWSFSSEDYPYAGIGGDKMSIYEDISIDGVSQDGYPKNGSGEWRMVDMTHILVNCPAAGYTNKTFTVDVTDDQLTINNGEGELTLTKVSQ
ncbi:MAG: hypothetical protein K5839_04400 [Treponemataceae bacterium]|nr:hypothetical protein [Treponemataceae bacterium]